MLEMTGNVPPRRGPSPAWGHNLGGDGERPECSLGKIHMPTDWRHRLDDEMKQQRLNMKSLSLRAGLGETYVRDVLVRGRGGKLEQIKMLADALGVSDEWLMHGRGDKYLSTAPEYVRRQEVKEKKPERSSRNEQFRVVKASPQVHHSGTAEPTTRVRVLGIAQAGVWTEAAQSMRQEGDAFGWDDNCFPPHPNWPVESQYDLIVSGTSMNRFALPGERLRCIDMINSRAIPVDGAVVVVRRVRDNGALVEISAKRLKVAGNALELHPDSSDPEWAGPEHVITVEGLNGDPESPVQVIGVVLFKYAAAPAPFMLASRAKG